MLGSLPPPLKICTPVVGEVASFVDDDQFGPGQSVDKCGYEIVALYWHSVRRGQRNPYSAAQIHAMAHDDYEAANGPDTAANWRGMTDQGFYDDMTRHGLHYKIIPRQWGMIRTYLQAGYPVFFGGVDEKSVYDLAAKECPYRWERPAGAPDYFHVILATGLDGPDSLLFRDTANLDDQGRLRPGPRRYRTSSMRWYGLTAVLIPTWMPPV